MFKFLKGVVGSGGGGIKDLPYTIGEPYSYDWGSWTHYRGTSKDDNSPVSIFSLTCTSSQDGRLAAARNGVKRLRTVRHPNVVSFLHSTEAETVEGSMVKPTIYIVTEPVVPLEEKIKELNLDGAQRDEYFAWGLHQVAKAVSFLNNDCKLVHGNVCIAAVVVTQNLDWKVHAFDVLSEFDGSNKDASGPMLPYEWLVGTHYKPMELVNQDWTMIRKSPPWAIDSWGLGCLIYELFTGRRLSKTEELRNTGCIPKMLLADYQRLLGSTPARRLNATKLIENCEFFQNKLVETIQFMEVLNLKDSVEKDSFFRKLPTLADQLPREIVLRKLLPMLSSALEFGSAAAPALNPFLKLGTWLPIEEFSNKVLPTVIKLFASNDRGIRVSLLQHIEQFGPCLSVQVVDEQVFPHVASGFSDTSAFLRELTLKATLTLAPKLSQRTLTGSLLKHLSKLQVDEEPAIRTNTTILLGNIAGYLNEATRKRVLLNAFTARALRDGFAPARAAGVMALSATSSYYDASEIATRILPHLVVLTVDMDSDVRGKAFKATEQFLQLIKEHLEKSGADEGTLSNTFSSSNTNAGLLGWAMSSLTLKSKGIEQNAGVSVTTTTTMSNTSLQNPDSSMIQTPPPHLPSNSQQNEYHSPPSPSSTDGWGDLDESEPGDDYKNGWGDMDETEEFAQPSSITQFVHQQKPVLSQKIHEESHSNMKRFTKDTEAIHDEDPWVAIAAPPPESLSKPLGLSHTVNRGPAAPQSKHGQHVSLEAVLGSKSSSEGNLHVSGTGRGRGRTTMKLGAQRIRQNSS